MNANDITQDLSKNLTNINTDFSHIAKAGVSLFILIFVYYILNKFIKKIIDNSIKIDKNIKLLLFRLLKIVYIFVTIMIVASFLGINTSSLLAIFSLFGLAISLSVQNLISNIANAINILTNKPFVIGDYVKIADIEGTVEDISFMYTKLVTINHDAIFLNNTTVGTANIINYTKHNERRITQVLGLSYDAPFDLVKKAIRETIENEPLVLKDKEIYVALTGYLDSSIEWTVRVYTKKENYIECRDNLMANYKYYFDKYNIEIPYPNMNIHIINKD